MARLDYDEVWEKQADGNMKLLSRVERTVSDEEEDRERRPDRLQELAGRPTAGMTPVEKDELLELLVRQFLGL